MSSARFDRADVARDLRRVASVGAVDQEPRRARQMPPWHIDKTVGIQEFKNDRSLSDDQIDDDRRSGSTPARRRATRRTCRAAKVWPSEQGWNFAKLFGQTEPDLIIKSTPWTQKAGAERRVVEAGRRDRPHRAALGARDRNPSGHRQGPQDHASRDRPPPAGRDRSAGAESDDRQRQRRSPARSWNGPSASRAR